MRGFLTNRTWAGKAIAAAVCAVVVTMLLAVPGPSSRRAVGRSGFSPGGYLAEAGDSGGQNLAERSLIGLFSEDFAGILKKKVPSSEWSSVRNVRLFVKWRDVEPKKSQFDWSALDAEINAILSLGVNGILMTLGGPTPPFATNKNNPGDPQMGPPKDVRDWGDFCGAVASRYKKYVNYYQIWQEPGWDIDAPPAKEGLVYFSGRADFSYIGMLRAAYKSIKAADSDSLVITGSLMNGLVREPSSFVNYELLMSGANQDFSMKVESGANIVAERPMYFNYHGAWAGGTVNQGIKAPGTSWYLAEGATHPGFEEWITIQNPGGASTEVTITYMFPGGGTQVQTVNVGSHSRCTVDVNSAVGPYRDVAARLVSKLPIVVERPMYFNYHGTMAGGSVESGVDELSKSWYLAEGATHPGFEEWISLMNPASKQTKVTITYMFPGGETKVQKLQMPPTSRETILVNNVVGPNRDVSARIEAENPIIAERPMYFNYQGKWPGGHSQVGANEPATSWFLSEGTTRDNPNDGRFEEWISLMNPGDAKAKVDFTYMFPGGGTKKASLDVPAHARETVLVNNVVGPNQDVSVQLDSSQPIVVERPMYFDYHGKYQGGDVERGCRESGKIWYFAEGTTREGFEEWLTLQNPNAKETVATITFMFGDGSTQQKQVALPPNSRTTVGVNLSVSMGTVCDAVAVHPYDYPQYWSWYYGSVVGICGKYGFGSKEVAATEIGWPNGTRSSFTPEGQRQAIGEVGVGSLFAAGCRKIWIFQDVDRPPGTSPNGDYYGLFSNSGAPFPSWGEYKKWQSQLPDFGNKPTKLWQGLR